MTLEEAQSSALAEGRRRFPRLPMAGHLGVYDRTADVAMALEDVSFGGMRTRSPIPLPPGHQHDLEMRVPGLGPLTFHARVVHCQTTSGSSAVHTVGWCWSTDHVTARSVTRLMTHLTTPGVHDAEPVVPRSRGAVRH